MPPTPLAEMLVKDLSQEKIQEEKIEQPRLLEIKQPQMERPALENADVNVPQIKKASNELENSVPVSQEEVKIVPEKAEPSGFAKVRLQCRITENQSDPQSMTQVSAQPMTSPSKDVACPGVLLKTETSISELSPVVIEQTPSIKPCDVMELPLPQPLFDNLDSLGKPKTCTTCNIPPSSPEVWRKQAEQSIVSGDNYHQDQNALQKILGQGNLSLKEWDTLNNHGDYAAEFIPEIEKILQSGTSQQQLHAAYTFYQVTGAIEPASSRFKKGLKSTDANEVGIAAFYLGQIGKPANVFVDDLKKLSRNGSPIVRTHASEALIRIDGPRTEYQLALCQCAEDDDSPVRVLAIAGLAQAGMELDNHVRESLFEFVKDEDTEVAAQAMLTLSLLRPVDPRLKEIVMKIKDDNIHPLHDTAVVAWQFMTDKSVTVK